MMFDTILKIYQPTIPNQNAGDAGFARFVDNTGGEIRSDVGFSGIVKILRTCQESIDTTYPPNILSNPSAASRRPIWVATNTQVGKFNALCGKCSCIMFIIYLRPKILPLVTSFL
jgi:hypothetical protein